MLSFRIHTLLVLLTVFLVLTSPGCQNGQHSGVAAPAPDIVDTAITSGSFNNLVIALVKADLADTLKGPGPFTVLAPTDAAFAELPRGTLENLFQPENKQQLRNILQYHVVAGKLTAHDLTELHSVSSLLGRDLPIRTHGHTLMVDNARVTQTDITCTNGIIHAIDTVLIP